MKAMKIQMQLAQGKKTPFLSKLKSNPLILGETAMSRVASTRILGLHTDVMAQMAASDFISTGDLAIGGLAVSSFLYACRPFLGGEGRLADRQAVIDDDEAIKWTVAGVISCIPYFNWLAWVFVGLGEVESSPYFFLAALYGLPFLAEGFKLGSLSWFMLVTGALHLQVERILETEKESKQMHDKQEIPSIMDFILSVQSKASMLLPSVHRENSSQKDFIGKELSDAKPKQMSIKELVEKKMDMQTQELEDLKEIADIEKSMWDKRFVDGKEPTKD